MPSLRDLTIPNQIANNTASFDLLQPSFMINHKYGENGVKQTLDMLLANSNTEPRWAPCVENELGRLTQGFENCV